MNSESSKEEDRKVKGKGTPSGVVDTSRSVSGEARPQRGEVQRGIADADKKARTGSAQEPVRNTPPAGDWNDVA